MATATISNGKLLLAVFARLILVLVLLGVIFFSTAGSFSYINGWIYIGTILVTLSAGFAALWRKDKSLLEKRIKTSEKEKKQKLFVLFSGVLILALYVLPGLDYRFSWSRMPLGLAIAGEIPLVFGYILNMRVMLVNSYASRVVEIQERQKVVDTGPYAVVRHPMYAAMIFIYSGTCLILSSYIALIPCALVIIGLGYRAVNEEKTLLEGLEGYAEYTKKVKYRMVPFVW